MSRSAFVSIRLGFVILCLDLYLLSLDLLSFVLYSSLIKPIILNKDWTLYTGGQETMSELPM